MPGTLINGCELGIWSGFGCPMHFRGAVGSLELGACVIIVCAWPWELGLCLCLSWQPAVRRPCMAVAAFSVYAAYARV